MNLGDFAQGALFYTAMNPVYKQQADMRQAELEQQQQAVAMGKLQQQAMQGQIEQQQKLQESNAGIAANIQEAQKADASTFLEPRKAASFFQQQAVTALAAGNSAGFKEMQDLAKGKLKEADEAETRVLEKVAGAKESLASAATEFADNPTPEGQEAVSKAALAAGIPMTQIPSDPVKFKAWAQAQQTASMTAKDRLALKEKQQEFQQKQAEQAQAQKDRHQERVQQMQQTAQYQQGLLSLRKEMLEARRESAAERSPVVKDIAGKPYQYDPGKRLPGTRDLPDTGWVQVGGEKLTALQKSGIAKARESGALITTALDNITKLPVDARTGPFMGLHAKNAWEALSAVGGRKLTPTQAQLMEVNAAGIGTEAGLLMSAMGGRTPNEAQQAELKALMTPAPGDTGITAKYKLAHSAQTTLTYLENLPGDAATKDPKVKETITRLKQFPSVDEVLKEAAKAGYSDQVWKQQKKVDAALSKQPQTHAATGALPALPAGGGLPSGWTIKEHN